MDRPTRIPLFPLDVVLFPKMALPLHIFEPRYKVMIRRCLNEKLEFGLILAASHGAATVGCTAEIMRTFREYPDGRMDILTQGRALFRLEDLIDEKEYYEGRVAYLADNPFLRDPEKEAKLLEAFSECHALLVGQAWPGVPPEENSILTYRLAAQLPVELETRQVLLEMRSESERRSRLLGWIREFLPKLKESQRVQQLASGNGHGYAN
jgi:Lon protease-like protein